MNSTEHFRDEFVPANGIYLLNHSVGRPPTNSDDISKQQFFDAWANDGADVWSSWLSRIEEFRQSLGHLLNCDTGDLCPQTNLSSALTKVLYSLPTEKRRPTLLYSAHDFPSIAFVLRQAERSGYQTRVIPTSANVLDLDCWAEYLTDDVRFVLITQVHSNTGQKVDVAGICNIARACGTFSVVDVAQSVGVIPIDLQAWHADFVIGSCVKWLCGGPGAGFLWANKDLIEKCKPVDVGWFSHSDPFEFDAQSFRYAKDALRFWGGTPSVLPYVVATNSIDLINRIGVEQIRKHNLELSSSLIDHVNEQTLISPTDVAHRGGTVVLNFADRQAAVEERLTQANVLFDSRPSGIRLSPHIYNSAADIERVVGCF